MFFLCGSRCALWVVLVGSPILDGGVGVLIGWGFLGWAPRMFVISDLPTVLAGFELSYGGISFLLTLLPDFELT